MLKQLEGVPGVKWKSPIEPVLNLKGLPKKTKLKKPREKKTITQKVIDSLDEYYQSVRQPIKLPDFMSGLKIGETEEGGDADFLHTEVCRVISVVPSTSINEKYVKKEAPEACMMVLSMDCSSEEDLYFPEEDESDPDLASQMEHVNLGGDSESADESPDATMADSEENMLSNESEPEVTAQVQLRSGFRAEFLNAVSGLRNSPSAGLFIDSCHAHCQSGRQAVWLDSGSTIVDNNPIGKAVADWFYDRTATKLIDNCSYPCNPSCHDISDDS
ncbi:hypothetical protein M5K25_026966 [Dendrobium thyrsiflorum]|uniref:Pectin acetylesterase n=1 Tax=Dendrobium thyrsiflorum TaxID=117978 RepID=A0ABD0TYZ8_DENTH